MYRSSRTRHTVLAIDVVSLSGLRFFLPFAFPRLVEQVTADDVREAIEAWQEVEEAAREGLFALAAESSCRSRARCSIGECVHGCRAILQSNVSLRRAFGLDGSDESRRRRGGVDRHLVEGRPDLVLCFADVQVGMHEDAGVYVDAVAVGDELVELVFVRLQHRAPDNGLREHVGETCRFLLSQKHHVVEDLLSVDLVGARIRREDLGQTRLALLDDVHQAARTECALELPEEGVDKPLLYNVGLNVDRLGERARQRRVDLV